MREALVRHGGWSLGLLALVLALTGVADGAGGGSAAERKADAVFAAQERPRPNQLLRLNRKGKVPLAALPTVRNSQRLGGRRAKAWRDTCSAETVDMGSWCLMSNFVEVTGPESNRNDFFYAVAKCGELGGYLPSAGELLGAADRVKLAGTIDDNEVTAATDLDPTDGLEDRREMSSTLITTVSGGSAAGSQGVTPGSKGNPRAGEPDPVPMPADPAPDTLQYVTVFDNRNRGGFAGGKEVSQPENFRCAFHKVQGGAGGEQIG
jgi:hypothetical protein